MEDSTFTKQPALQSILLIGGCGYIGSYLYQQLERAGFSVTVVDLLTRGNPLDVKVIQDDYANLKPAFLSKFDAVLWFAGHSSVGQSMSDPNGAIANNCLNLFSFAKCLSPHTKFIYASSASLYSSSLSPILPANELSLTSIPSQNAYDISKFAFDYLAEHFLSNFFALRMGTLSGYSPNLRPELVFNAMNIAAVATGRVVLRNSESRRTILFLEDLWALVYKLLLTEQKSGIYNAGSMSFRMQELAHGIADTWHAEVKYEGESETYSFLLDTELMTSICGEDMANKKLSEQCRDFIRQYQDNDGSAR